MRGLTRLPGDEEKKRQRGISTSDGPALSMGDWGANVGAERTGAARTAPGKDDVQRVE